MKSIRYLREKIKPLEDILQDKDILVVLIIILTACASFGLGRLSKINENRTPLQIFSKSQSANVQNSVSITGKYVASKSGTKYHLPWCSGAQRISEKNKIWFNSKEEAESRGYTPAKNCKGI